MPGAEFAEVVFMQRRASMVLVIAVLSACGRESTKTPFPVVTLGNTPAPDASLNDPSAPSLVQAPTNTFTGTVAELHAFQNRKSGLPVTLPFVVVTANSGNGETMYVADPEITDFAGIMIERCDKADKTCKGAPPTLGSNVQIVGTLFVNKDGGATIGKAVVTAVAGDMIDLHPRGVLSTEVTPDQLTGNEAIRGLPIHVVDTDGNPSLFVVEDLAPADDTNANFPADLETQCGVDNLQKPENAMASCCPAGIGPKYFSFVVREVASGRKVNVQTGNYKDISFNAWPCGSRDVTETLKVGDTFTTLGGIFDVAFSKASISPGGPSHYVLVRK
jgi:hypothetical protein